MNVKVVANAYLDTSGSFDKGVLNERGKKLLQGCFENKLCITNTQFLKPRKKLEKWTSPDRRTRNQMDFIIVDKHQKCTSRQSGGHKDVL